MYVAERLVHSLAGVNYHDGIVLGRLTGFTAKLVDSITETSYLCLWHTVLFAAVLTKLNIGGELN